MVTAGFASCQVRFTLTRVRYLFCNVLLSVTMVASRLFGGDFVSGEMNRWRHHWMLSSLILRYYLHVKDTALE